MPPLKVEARRELWPLKEAFTISRGSKTAAEVVVVEISNTTSLGRGEAVPYARYGESVDGVLQQIASIAPAITSREHLQHLMKPGAARNALDCALWDLEAKLSGQSVTELAGRAAPVSKITSYTLSLDTPEAMAAKALQVAHLPLLKMKLGGAGDDDRMRAVRAVRPEARLLVDANEAWTVYDTPRLMSVAAACGVELIEQPLPAGQDAALRDLARTVPVCADESVHDVADLPRLDGLYDAVNVKLDKAGGLTAAIALVDEARRRKLKIMVGSMVATSLAVAPAMLLASDADWIDLDGPLLLAQDREPPLQIDGGWIFPPSSALWG